MINVAVVNAHILFREVNGLARGDAGYTLLNFIEILVKQLAYPNAAADAPATTVLVAASRRSLETCLKDPRRKAGFHESSINRRCRGGPNTQRKCIWCGKDYIITMCAMCSVPLCVLEGDYDPASLSCYRQFHEADLEY
jgi:hypothetical protein